MKRSKKFPGLLIVALISVATATAQDPSGPILSAESPTALRRIRTPEETMAKGYTYEATLAVDVTCPYMQMYNPKRKLTQWVRRVRETKEFITIPEGSVVHILEGPNGELDYKDFAIWSIPSQSGKLIPGCLNVCRGADIRLKLRKFEAPPPPPEPEPPPKPEPPPVALIPVPVRCRPCNDMFLVDAKKERWDSVKHGVWKNLRNGGISGGVSAYAGWEGALTAFGIAFFGGMIADASNPTVYSVRAGIEGNWRDFPIQPTVVQWCEYTIRMSLVDTPLGGKVAQLLVDNYPECSRFLPLPHNTNNVFAFAAPDFNGDDKDRDHRGSGRRDSRDNDRHRGDKDHNKGKHGYTDQNNNQPKNSGYSRPRFANPGQQQSQTNNQSTNNNNEVTVNIITKPSKNNRGSKNDGKKSTRDTPPRPYLRTPQKEKKD
jgi:hypothetical protein